MSGIAKPRLPIGSSDFSRLRDPGVVFVDKTSLITRILDAADTVLLFPRPRRFGKSTNLSMLAYFLGKSAKDHAPLFQDLAVWRSASARKHFQRYPLIYLTFKDIKQDSWAACYETLAELIVDLYREHRMLLASGNLVPADQEFYAAILERRASRAQHERALKNLARYLSSYHGERVVILIDEYDTPLHTAFVRGYFDAAVGFFRSFLSGGLKDNQHLAKGVLTGILRIATESLFSGLNNPAVYSLLTHQFAADFGFTEEEVKDLILRSESKRSMADLRRWYDGYDWAGQVIYNPWSVLNALANPEDPLQPYWVNTASDDLIRELVFRFGGGEEGEGEALLRGEGIRKVIREDTVLRDIYRDADALWSFLLFTGYLKAEDVRSEQNELRAQRTGTLKIPNLEVSSVFARLFGDWLQLGVGGERRLREMGQALLKGDLATFGEHLSRVLVESASFLDMAGNSVKMPPEHVYQAFILGLLVHLGTHHRVRSNREGGHGRYDVMVIPKEAGQPGAVLELKVKKKGETLQRALTTAKQQLRQLDYAAELRAHGAYPIQQVAVAFDGKKVLVGDAAAPTPKKAARRRTTQPARPRTLPTPGRRTDKVAPKRTKR